ncbi:MAG: hypothetical protein POELPBGB_01026 [Bacteroidia bacterium]|nr:hypothetical protein [Bacteroidia bacterium]
MKTEQRNWTANKGWHEATNKGLNGSANLVTVFGSRAALSDPARFNEIKAFYPNAQILSGTTSGEIFNDTVYDDSIVVSAVEFEKTKIKTVKATINEYNGDSYATGAAIANQLKAADLKHVFVLSDGLKVNGSELSRGLNDALENKVTVTGGLAGDAAKFEKTLVGLNDSPSEGNIVAVGFYGDALKVGFGSVGGWDVFGVERHVTKSVGNVLYELDGQPALDLYKMYLGDKAKDLPGSALLFPLGMKVNEDAESLVRTVLAVNEEDKSMTFAGDIPQGATVRLMKANFDKLIDGAGNAAENSYQSLGSESDFAILISCVGRKLVLDQRIEEEVEAVRDILGNTPSITGFYSYGEISPLMSTVKCELHNQTMTITTFTEA